MSALSYTKMPGEPHVIPAVDGYPLVATLFQPDTPNHKTLVIASAMGVLQGYYASFASYLCSLGFRVITFDYRGVGRSAPENLKGFNAMLHDWGEQDLEAIFQFVLNTYPDDQLQFLSHSVGGQIFGLTPSNNRVQRAVMVASQSGYWNMWPVSGKPRMWLVSHVFIPALTGLVGYLPAKKLNLFEDVPKGVARQWAKWIRNQQYMFSDQRDTLKHFEQVTASMQLYSFSDDTYAPPATVDWLAQRYPNAIVERVNLQPGYKDLKSIGHFNFFKSKYGPYFWEEVAGFLVN